MFVHTDTNEDVITYMNMTSKRKSKASQPASVQEKNLRPLSFFEANEIFRKQMQKHFKDDGSNDARDLEGFMDCLAQLDTSRVFCIQDVVLFAKARDLNLSKICEMFLIYTRYLTEELGVLMSLPPLVMDYESFYVKHNFSLPKANKI